MHGIPNDHYFYSFCNFAGLLDTITSTADSKDCPGVCMHTLATIICYEVLENVVCPTPSMKCCVESPTNATSSPAAAAESPSYVQHNAADKRPALSPSTTAADRPFPESATVHSATKKIQVEKYTVAI